ncbi:hypothetical protein [Chryseobacterium chendengshani]|uniref:hypothetical protein n=1 Tax=Chryseobacterium sp. LJ756 TaxID=2864113 RepID=UPI001C63D833|nr:hypothetical protein [Chryseobacterium sp. LJ756]MBW7676170.1 hypothetical protein [Chryseobacterium sp. LJ756]
MGCDNTNYLPITTNIKDLQEFITLLGYEKHSKDYYFQYDKNTKEQITGISLTIKKEEYLQVHTRTTIWRSIKDHEIHNWTIKQLRKRFGGFFISDEGKSKYLWFGGTERRKDEAGCDLAFYDFKNNIATIHGFLQIVERNKEDYPIHDITRYYNPLISSLNIGLPFLISILEQYLRDTYISLLKYSSKKKEIFKKSNIQTEELFDVTENKISIEEVIARFKSFQNLDLITKNFKEIDIQINFTDTLKRKNPKLKYYEKLESIITKRHFLIHRFEMDYYYTTEQFKKDLKLIEKIVTIFYDRIIEVKSWNKRDW